MTEEIDVPVKDEENGQILKETQEKEKELNARQEAAINFLLSSRTKQEAAQLAGVTSSTMSGWLKDPVFVDALKERTDFVLTEAMAFLKNSATSAARELLRIMQEATREETKRLAACNIIDYSLKCKELEDLGIRVEQIERVILEKKSVRHGRSIDRR